MPISKRDINRVLNVKGYAFVDPAEMPNLTQRYTESYIRRRLFDVEDATVLRLYRMYQSAQRDISIRATVRADAYDITTLDKSPQSMAWRREILDFVEVRLRELALSVARESYDRVVLSYMAAFYGKLWMLDSMTVDNVVNIPRLSPAQASGAVMSDQILEDTGDQLIYDLMGREWREKYRDELDDAVRRIRGVFNRGMGEGKTVPELMRGVADVLGVSIDRRRTGIPDVRANFNRVQVITRSYFINANNNASLEAYRANSDVVAMVQFITANDGRVCPTCLGYRNQMWALDSPQIVHPVSDTHPMCRCSLVPVVWDQIMVVADDYPPEIDYGSWLAELGLGALLSGFFRDSGDMDSDRVYDDEEPEFGFG